jgi:hypothetical protein
VSLIDEALRKARLEAARQDAERRGLPSPAAAAGLPGRRPRRRSRLGLLTVAVAVVVALGGGYLAWRPAASPPTSSAAVGGAEKAAAARAELPVGESADPTRAGDGEVATSPPAAEGAAPTALRAARAPSPPTAPVYQPPAAARPPAAGATAPPAPKAPPAAVPTPPPPPAATAAPAPASETAPAAAPPAPRSAAAAPAAPAAARADAAGAGPVYHHEVKLPAGGSLVLSGIAWRESDPIAVLNGQALGPNEGIAGYLIVGIDRDRVHLRGPDGPLTLLLR